MSRFRQWLNEEDDTLKHLWNSSGVGVFLWFISGLLVLYWFYRVPPPGYAIGALAVVAGIMSVREMKTLAKVSWVFLLVCLLIMEFRAIDKDRADNNQKQREFFDAQRKGFQGIATQADGNFKETAKGLEEAIRLSHLQFTTTMNSVTGILAKQDKTLTQTIGGTSYPMFLPTFPANRASMEMPVWVITPGKFSPQGYISTPEEMAPLPDVTVDVREDPINVKSATEQDVDSWMHPTHYSLGTLIVPGMFTAPFTLRMGKRYSLVITTRRGSFREEIHIDRDTSAQSGWQMAWCMFGRQTIHDRGKVTTKETLLEGKCN
jgi:hypothetical protein